MDSNETPKDETLQTDLGHWQEGEFGVRGESVAALSTNDYPTANRDHEQIETNQGQQFQSWQYVYGPPTLASPAHETNAGFNPLNDQDFESKPPAQLMQTEDELGAAALSGVAASEYAAAFEPTPLPPTTQFGAVDNPVGFDSVNSAHALGAFQPVQQSLSGMSALHGESSAQPQVPVPLGCTGAPQVDIASTQASFHQQPTPQSLFTAADSNGSQNYQNEIAFQQQQQQNLALLQMLQPPPLMLPQLGLVGNPLLFPPHASLATLGVDSAANPLSFGMTPQVSVSGQSSAPPPMPRASNAATNEAATNSSRSSAVATDTEEPQQSVGTTYTGQKKPKRALSAYNIFFKEERAKLLEETEENGDETIRETKRRRRQKGSSLRKIGFEEMGRIIGRKWKQIDSQTRSYYDRQAAEDKKRFKLELEIYNKRQIRLIDAELQRQEATVSEETRKIYLEADGKGKSQTKK